MKYRQDYIDVTSDSIYTAPVQFSAGSLCSLIGVHGTAFAKALCYPIFNQRPRFFIWEMAYECLKTFANSVVSGPASPGCNGWWHIQDSRHSSGNPGRDRRHERHRQRFPWQPTRWLFAAWPEAR